jgi:hypothetical protein
VVTAGLLVGVTWATWHVVPLFQMHHAPAWVAWATRSERARPAHLGVEVHDLARFERLDLPSGAREPQSPSAPRSPAFWRESPPSARRPFAGCCSNWARGVAHHAQRPRRLTSREP